MKQFKILGITWIYWKELNSKWRIYGFKYFRDTKTFIIWVGLHRIEIG
jgi:hypothetical protein